MSRQYKYTIFVSTLIGQDGERHKQASVIDEDAYQSAVSGKPAHDYSGKPKRVNYQVWSGDPDAIPDEYYFNAPPQERPKQTGRSERIYARVTPEIKAALEKLTTDAGISVADWIEQRVKEQST